MPSSCLCHARPRHDEAARQPRNRPSHGGLAIFRGILGFLVRARLDSGVYYVTETAGKHKQPPALSSLCAYKLLLFYPVLARTAANPLIAWLSGRGMLSGYVMLNQVRMLQGNA